jgi:phosphate-selective porin OprO and OprP
MKKFYQIICLSILIPTFGHTQLKSSEFGKGFNVLGKDSTFTLRAAFRMQSLFINDWTVNNDDLGNIGDHASNFLIRRARLKFDGFAYSPKLKYKMELGLSNRDIGAQDISKYNSASNVVMDAYLVYNFYKGFSILAGQTKLPGNRERVISSGNLQFVDRSRLNSRINLDRDIGIQLIHAANLGKQAKLKSTFAFSQGEGRNMTTGNIGGYEYTFRTEFYPFGSFTSKGDYVGSSIKREEKPKLAIGATVDYNERAGRTRGNLGSFINASPDQLKTLKTAFVDMMFKYQGFSMMGEYAIRGTADKNPQVIDDLGTVLAKYYTGSALNLQAGYMFKKNYEFALRYTKVVPHNATVGVDENQYFIGFSRYFKGHNLKLQTDFGYIQLDGKDDELVWRTQIDIHF